MFHFKIHSLVANTHLMQNEPCKLTSSEPHTKQLQKVELASSILDSHASFRQHTLKQECIPVGRGGVCLNAYFDTPPLLGVGLETPSRVWAWSPPPARSLKLPLGCGPGNLQGMPGYTHPL